MEISDPERPASASHIRRATGADAASLARLYLEARWLTAQEARPESIRRLVEGSICCFAAFADRELVGMGRAIGDGVSDAYIQDLYVSAPYRHLGMATRIVEAIVAFLDHSGVSWVGLIAEPGTQKFYEKLGFAVLADHQPMLLKRKGK